MHYKKSNLEQNRCNLDKFENENNDIKIYKVKFDLELSHIKKLLKIILLKLVT